MGDNIENHSLGDGYGLWKWRSLHFRRVLLLMLVDVFGLLMWLYLLLSGLAVDQFFGTYSATSSHFDHDPWCSIYAVIPLAVLVHLWGIMNKLLPEGVLPGHVGASQVKRVSVFFLGSVVLSLVIVTSFFSNHNYEQKVDSMFVAAAVSSGVALLHHLGCPEISSWALYVCEVAAFCAFYAQSRQIHLVIFVQALVCLTILVVAAHFYEVEWVSMYVACVQRGGTQKLPPGVPLCLKAKEFVLLMDQTLCANSALLGTYYSVLTAFDARSSAGATAAAAAVSPFGSDQAVAVDAPVADPARAAYRLALEDCLVLLRHSRLVSLALLVAGRDVDDELNAQADLGLRMDPSDADEHVTPVSLVAACWQICHLIERSQGKALPLFVSDTGLPEGVAVSPFRMHVAVELVLFLVLYDLVSSCAEKGCMCHVVFREETSAQTGEFTNVAADVGRRCRVEIAHVTESGVGAGGQKSSLAKLADRIAQTHLGSSIMTEGNPVTSPQLGKAADGSVAAGGVAASSRRRANLSSVSFWRKAIDDAADGSDWLSGSPGSDAGKLTRTVYSFDIPGALLNFPPRSADETVSSSPAVPAMGTEQDLMAGLDVESAAVHSGSTLLGCRDVYFRPGGGAHHRKEFVDGAAVAGKLRPAVLSTDCSTLEYPCVFLEEDSLVDNSQLEPTDKEEASFTVFSARSGAPTEVNPYAGVKRGLSRLTVPFLSCKLADLPKVLTKDMGGGRSGHGRERGLRQTQPFFQRQPTVDAASKTVPSIHDPQDHFCDSVSRVVFLKASVAMMPAAVYMMSELAKIVDVKTVFVCPGGGEVSTREIEDAFLFSVNCCISASISALNLSRILIGVLGEMPPRCMRETVLASEFPVESLFTPGDQLLSDSVKYSASTGPVVGAAASVNMASVTTKLRDLGLTIGGSYFADNGASLAGVADRSSLLSRYRYDLSGGNVSRFHLDAVQINSHELPGRLKHCYLLGTGLSDFLGDPEVCEWRQKHPFAGSVGGTGASSRNAVFGKGGNCFTELSNYCTILLHVRGTEDIFADGLFVPNRREWQRAQERETAAAGRKTEKSKRRDGSDGTLDLDRWKHGFVLKVTTAINEVRLLVGSSCTVEPSAEDGGGARGDSQVPTLSVGKSTIYTGNEPSDPGVDNKNGGVKSSRSKTLEHELAGLKHVFKKHRFVLQCLMVDVVRALSGCRSLLLATRAVSCKEDAVVNSPLVQQGLEGSVGGGCDSVQTATALMHKALNMVETLFWEQLAADGQKRGMK